MFDILYLIIKSEYFSVSDVIVLNSLYMSHLQQNPG